MGLGRACVVSVSRSAGHGFSKAPCAEIRLLAGLGVGGDAHCGATVRHRYLVKRDPTAANLTQVHLIAAERLEELGVFGLRAGDVGENVTTRGVHLMGLSVGSLLRLGAEAVVEVTGVRTPCYQMNKFKSGLMGACIGRVDGEIVRNAGVMGVVKAGGVVRVGDLILVEMPAVFVKMGPV